MWTGTELIVWGGNSGTAASPHGDGARYNPTANTWTALSTTNAPTARSLHTAVWGGAGASGVAAPNGARYNPTTGNWTAMIATNQPAARTLHTAVWTGKDMLVWGGLSFAGTTLSGGATYNPMFDFWTPTSFSDFPVRAHAAVWDGTQMWVFGGQATGAATDGTLVSDYVSNELRNFSPQVNVWLYLRP